MRWWVCMGEWQSNAMKFAPLPCPLSLCRVEAHHPQHRRSLLEVRWGELEGEAGRGTGSLESDVALLERGQLPLRLRLAVTYRAHVKRAAREWGVLGRRALAHVMERARGGGEGK